MVQVGQKLHEARISQSLTLEEIALKTKIRPEFLTAIEKGEYDKLPSSSYAQGFVRNYASFLGLSQKEIMPLFRREFDEKKTFKVLPDGMTHDNSFSMTRMRIQQSFLIIALAGIALLGYLGFQYRSMFISPMLTVYSPKQNAQTKDEVTVSGKTDPNATVLINNEPVLPNTDGEFTKNLTLFPGKTAIVLKAKNRFGKETILERNIDVQN
jgi:cytoskeletal protein RodZ